MTRESYITMRAQGNFNIVYNYYREHFDSSKHSPFFNITDLANLLVKLGFNIDSIMEKAVKYYDTKFDVRILSDKDGKIVKII